MYSGDMRVKSNSFDVAANNINKFRERIVVSVIGILGLMYTITVDHGTGLLARVFARLCLRVIGIFACFILFCYSGKPCAAP